MPVLIYPLSDQARLVFIDRAIDTAKKDKANNHHYLTDETLASAEAVIPGFRTAQNVVTTKLSERSLELDQKNTALNRLETHIRDAWEIIKRRVHRLNEPAQVLTYYQLPLSGSVPKPSNNEAWLDIAQKVIAGDAEAVAKGYASLVCPTVAEIQAALDEATKESGDVAIADRDYDQAQETVEQLRPQVDEVIGQIIADLRYFLRKKDEASMRRIMKTYGVTFRYLQGEPPEEEPAENES